MSACIFLTQSMIFQESIMLFFGLFCSSWNFTYIEFGSDFKRTQWGDDMIYPHLFLLMLYHSLTSFKTIYGFMIKFLCFKSSSNYGLFFPPLSFDPQISMKFFFVNIFFLLLSVIPSFMVSSSHFPFFLAISLCLTFPSFNPAFLFLSLSFSSSDRHDLPVVASRGGGGGGGRDNFCIRSSGSHLLIFAPPVSLWYTHTHSLSLSLTSSPKHLHLPSNHFHPIPPSSVKTFHM